MNLGIPQIIFITWNLLGLGVILARHGEPREGKYNFFFSLIVTVIMFVVLWWGGFF